MAAVMVFQKVGNDPPFGMERVNTVALTIVLKTSIQKPSRASFTSDGFEAGAEEEEERLISNFMQVSLETQKFAGRPRHFVSALSITSDQNVLDIVQHCHLEICNPTQPRPRPQIQFDPKERETITSEIALLLELGVIEPAVHTQDEYISTIFVTKKKQRPIPHIEKHHFKMDTLLSAVRLMTPDSFMASIDLKDACYSVPIAEEHLQYHRFYWQGRLYQYTCIPNHSSAPRCFTKLLKPVYSTLRQKGHLNTGYI